MKLLTILTLAASASALAVQPRHHQGKTKGNGRNRNGGNRNGNAAAISSTAVAAAPATTSAAADATTGGTTTAASGQTIVLFEVNGVPGNECLTFRNNGKYRLMKDLSRNVGLGKSTNIHPLLGEIVDAACVNTAADRQITPTTIGGEDVLKVQRTFTAGFRPDLVDVDACVGFNGTHFKAVDCADTSNEPVTFTGGELRSTSGACASGHDGAAQLQVDPTGATCATFTSTDVQPATA
ncbi:hypothetical protein UCRPA7_8699 [Phaeoacremonium minimum UCRPA7]|uniref:Uncharacterized protein n=1 Tax=Phaeoacremonium minimum (strain UCR-PA7) TaxID=1286976 RepID=R8B966_PHAM7|nr:hypothetical protein UCRPA7_8699 [Phaeoacremonium minimum UCRPA7]EON95850.1 hypothetical protein UCRPA7_8699 [Phaeoacremonium minimum UCRPA7]